MPPVPPAPMESCTTIDLLLIAVFLAQIKSHTKVPVCMQVPTTRLGHKTLFEPVSSTTSFHILEEVATQFFA